MPNVKPNIDEQKPEMMNIKPNMTNIKPDRHNLLWSYLDNIILKLLFM